MFFGSSINITFTWFTITFFLIPFFSFSSEGFTNQLDFFSSFHLVSEFPAVFGARSKPRKSRKPRKPRKSRKKQLNKVTALSTTKNKQINVVLKTVEMLFKRHRSQNDSATLLIMQQVFGF